MKTNYLALLMTVIVLTLIFACKNEQNQHASLIQWIEMNKKSFKFSGDESEEMLDKEIISLLEDIARYNNYFDSTGRRDTNNSASRILNNSIGFDKYLNRLTNEKIIDTKPIGRLRASGYYNNYINARTQASTVGSIGNEIRMDKTEAILFTLPHIILGLKEIYNPQPSEWGDTTWWQKKGLVVYPANYGISGDSLGQNIWQTTVIIQPAKDAVDTETGKDSWEVEKRMYNYGDLKPPKLHITNENDTPK